MGQGSRDRRERIEKEKIGKEQWEEEKGRLSQNFALILRERERSGHGSTRAGGHFIAV